MCGFVATFKPELGKRGRKHKRMDLPDGTFEIQDILLANGTP